MNRSAILPSIATDVHLHLVQNVTRENQYGVAERSRLVGPRLRRTGLRSLLRWPRSRQSAGLGAGRSPYWVVNRRRSCDDGAHGPRTVRYKTVLKPALPCEATNPADFAVAGQIPLHHLFGRLSHSDLPPVGAEFLQIADGRGTAVDCAAATVDCSAARGAAEPGRCTLGAGGGRRDDWRCQPDGDKFNLRLGDGRISGVAGPSGDREILRLDCVWNRRGKSLGKAPSWFRATRAR